MVRFFFEQNIALIFLRLFSRQFWYHQTKMRQFRVGRMFDTRPLMLDFNLLNFYFNVDISRVGSEKMFKKMFTLKKKFTNFFPNLFFKIFSIQFLLNFFFIKISPPQSCHRRGDVKVSPSTICMYHPSHF